jgi:CHAT domain-containing protein
MIAQKKNAEAVLATLWDVNDASTSRMMADFYAQWARNPSLGKAEALRRAQLRLMHAGGAPDSSRGPDSGGGEDRGFGRTKKDVASALPGYAHPYYWSPFVLTGNFQ